MNKFSLKSFLLFGTGIVFVSIVSSLLFNKLHLGEIPHYQHFTIDSTVKEIDSKQALLIYRAQQAVFIDSRNPEKYESIHIKNAISLPFRSTREFKFMVMEKYNKDALFVVYCANASCELAVRLAGQLNYMGYKRVIIYRDGVEDWQAKGFPLGKAPRNE